jgi:DNA repair protein RecN (Recombination protein N)
MPNVEFKVDNTISKQLTDNGLDDINFLFSANKNGKLGEVSKVASGGEISRVMLCIKSLLSNTKGLPTIIFDEIDTGVSGEVASKMGIIMQEMSAQIQVLSITHLAQIACKGKQHYKVFKTDNEHSTQTSVKELTFDERVLEIAKMVSGKDISEAALSNAKELLVGKE